MPIENIMYFALGLLVAGMIALAILPAVWKRAVRLTKRRIEAATPITLAEFRADKDQLRAEFALSTRRLEMTIDGLRKRLAEQLGDVNQTRTDLGALKAEREKHLDVVREFEGREESLRGRLLELEKEGTDLAQRLRMRERELETRTAEIVELRNALRRAMPEETERDASLLSGDYEEDIDRLSTALAIERKRAAYLEEQARSLVARLDSSDRRSSESTAAITQMRDALAGRDAERQANAEDLVTAEARIANAENRLAALLDESTEADEGNSSPPEQTHPSASTSETDDLEVLRTTVGNVETTILADWDTDRADHARLRQRLNEISGMVSRLVYAADHDQSDPGPGGESLFDRVQRFADDGEGTEMLPTPEEGQRGAVSDRLSALRELQAR